MKENIMTIVMGRMTDMYKAMDKQIVKNYDGDMPYAMKKATEKEKRERFENLTPQELPELIKEYGWDEVNEWVGKYTGGN